MNHFSTKLTDLPFYARLSILLGAISGLTDVATATVLLSLSSMYEPMRSWGDIATSSVTFAGGLLVLVGSFLVFRRKYSSGAIMILAPGIFISLIEGASLITLLGYFGFHLWDLGMALVFLVVLGLPIASAASALSVKKKIISVKEGVIFKKRAYWKASFVLALISGLASLIYGFVVIGTWPYGVLSPFLIVDGALMMCGSFCVFRKKFTQGALLVLVPGVLYGFFGLPNLIAILIAWSGGHYWIFGLSSSLGNAVGLAFPIVSAILAIYSRE